MSEKVRMLVIVLALVVVGAALWYWQSTPLPDPTTPEDSAANSAPVATPAPSPAPAEPAEDPVTETPVVQASNPPSAPSRGGRGTLDGTIMVSGGLAVPADLSLVLHHVTDEARFDTNVDTVFAILDLGAKKEFEFSGLPLGWFVVFAFSETHSGTFSGKIESNRLDQTRQLVLRPTTSIAGTVVNEAGEAIPHASVFVAGYQDDGEERTFHAWRSRASMVTADEQGAFHMIHIESRYKEYRLCASAPGYAPTVSDVIPIGTRNARIVLGKGVTVAGRLVNQDTGEPAINATIHFTTKYDRTARVQETNGDGDFHFEKVSPGEYRFSLADEKMIVTPETITLDVFPERSIENKIVFIRTGGSFTGRIFDADTKRGIAGAKIHAFPRGIEDGESKDVIANASGEYEIVGLYDGTYEVRYGQVKGYSTVNMWEDRKQVVTAIGQRIPNIDFALSKGLSISGRVVDESGTPVERVRVQAGAQKSSGAMDTASTTSDGRFVFYGFDGDDTVRLSTSKIGLTKTSRTVELADQSISDIEITLIAESTISGVVVNNVGELMAGIYMYARGNDQYFQIQRRETSEQGTFIFKSLSAGTYDIRWPESPNQYSGSDPILETVELGSGEHVKDLRLVVDRKKVTSMMLSGRVTNDLGQPIEEVRVFTFGRAGRQISASTDSDGTYTLKNVPEGRVQLIYSEDNHGQRNVDFEGGATNADVVMKRNATISGRIIDHENQPITEFSARAYAGRLERDFGPQLIRYHHPKGEFSITNGQAGKQNFLLFRVPGFADKTVSVAEVRPGQALGDVLVQMEPESRLMGIVADENGAPVADAFVFNGHVPDSEYQHERNSAAKTGPDGRFEITRLATGTMVLSAFKKGYGPVTETIQISQTMTTTRLTLGSGATITGRITSDGVGLAEVGVHGHVQSDSKDHRTRTSIQTKTDAEGYFQFTGVRTGEGLLRASIEASGGRRNRSQAFETEDGMKTEVYIDFPSATASIEGYLYMAENETGPGIASATIRENGQLIESRYREVGDDGYFVFESLPAGKVTVRGNDVDRGRTSTDTVELVDGQKARVDSILFGGATVVCTVQNIPEGLVCTVGILEGSHSPPEQMSMTALESLFDQPIAVQEVTDGVAELKGVPQGTFTLVAIIYDEESMNTNTVFNIVSTPLTIKNEQEVATRVSF